MFFRCSSTLMSLGLATALMAGSAKAEIKLGLSVPLQGSLQLLGQQAATGARAAVDAANANGGINGEPIALTIVDDRCSDTQAREVAADLAGVQAVMGLLCFESAFALRDNPQLATIPFVSLTIRLPEYTQRNELNFRFGAGPEAESDAIVDTILRQWQGKSFALADDGTVYGRSLAQSVRTKLELAGRPPQVTETYRPTQNVQTGLARRLINASIEALFVAGDGEDVAVIAESLSRRGADIELMAGEAALAPFLPGSELAPPDGLIAIGPRRPENNAATQIIQQQFANSGLRGEGLVLSSYAATQTILQAIATSDDRPLNLRLMENRTSTILGPISFDQEGQRAGAGFIAYRYVDGMLQPADLSEPEEG
ncbi:MAG: ABC transporter substrate-binding protein [Pseudomonadota bacterium]